MTSLPPEVVTTIRDLLKMLSLAADNVEGLAGLTEQLAVNAANETEVREVATTGLLFVSKARRMVDEGREILDKA